MITDANLRMMQDAKDILRRAHRSKTRVLPPEQVEIVFNLVEALMFNRKQQLKDRVPINPLQLTFLRYVNAEGTVATHNAGKEFTTRVWGKSLTFSESKTIAPLLHKGLLGITRDRFPVGYYVTEFGMNELGRREE